eukprot:130952-Pleurochrysis_carterae.AAC.1
MANLWHEREHCKEATTAQVHGGQRTQLTRGYDQGARKEPRDTEEANRSNSQGQIDSQWRYREARQTSMKTTDTSKGSMSTHSITVLNTRRRLEGHTVSPLGRLFPGNEPNCTLSDYFPSSPVIAPDPKSARLDRSRQWHRTRDIAMELKHTESNWARYMLRFRRS